MQARIFEINYSVSPGGINTWELEIRDSIGYSTNYSGFKSAGEALEYLLHLYPAIEHSVDISSIEAYNNSMEDESIEV